MSLPLIYDELIARVPLRPIKDEATYKHAIEIIDELSRTELTEDAADYLLVLSLIVEFHEAEHYPIKSPPGRDVLKQLIVDSNLTYRQLAEQVGIPAETIKAFVDGQKDLTTQAMKAFAKRFNVKPSVFLDED